MNVFSFVHSSMFWFSCVALLEKLLYKHKCKWYIFRHTHIKGKN